MNLLPAPRHLVQTSGTLHLPDSCDIALVAPRVGDLLFSAERLKTALAIHTGVEAFLSGGDFTAPIKLVVDPSYGHAQGYRLTIDDERVVVAGNDLAGVFYGVCTLIQIVQLHRRELPHLTIDDHPDLLHRGVMLDISRDKVPKMSTLYHIVDLLAGMKVNQFQLYTEHTFAYRKHKQVWEAASPMTAGEILALDAYCRQRHIELVPNQNSFGHMQRWLKHDDYAHLGETEDPFDVAQGFSLPPFSLSPAVPGSITLLSGLYDELLPNFSSQQFNVGCDETFDLGKGRTRAWVDAKGKGLVYLDFLLQIYGLVSERGRTMQFWGDIISDHPELVPAVPKDTVALAWGYEADHDFAGKTALFAESGVPFYVCPGVSSWNSIGGRTANMRGNIKNAVVNGLKNGAIGLLNTDWGDRGHWQPLPVSYAGYAYGASMSWCAATNTDLDLANVLDAFVFQDAAGVMGKLALELGDIYRMPGFNTPNGSILFWSLQRPLDDFKQTFFYSGADDAEKALLDNPTQLIDTMQATVDAINTIIIQVENAKMYRADSELVQQEFDLTARMLKHGARHLMFQVGEGDANTLRQKWDATEEEFRRVWLERNRPGGLDDSAERFNIARAVYEG